jgi:HEPN domain-containing protein
MNEAALEVVRQWVEKAQSDWETVLILSAHERCPRDAVCFHCQQHVEKLLKALFTLHSIEAPRTHNLRRLIQLLETVSADLLTLKDASDALTAHGVASRYPDDWREIDEDEMKEILELTLEFRKILLPKLEPPDYRDQSS